MNHTPEGYFDSFRRTPQGELKVQYYNPFVVKQRRRTSKMQLKVLEKTFETNVRPDAALRKMLAEQLGMTSRSVQVWFQNRRAKIKKTTKSRTDDQQEYDETRDAGLYRRYEPLYNSQVNESNERVYNEYPPYYNNEFEQFHGSRSAEMYYNTNDNSYYDSSYAYNNSMNMFVPIAPHDNNAVYEKEERHDWADRQNSNNEQDDVQSFDHYLNI